MKAVFFFLLMALSNPVQAGNGVKGGDPIRSRFLIAHDMALKITRSPICSKFFSQSECRRMELKLTETSPSECEGNKLCWYNEDSANPMPPLKPLLNGKPMDAILITTSELSSPITVDVNRARELSLSQREATVVMMHEAGHAIGLSESLETDRRVIAILNQQSFDDSDARPIVFRVQDDTQSLSHKPPTDPNFTSPYQSTDFKLLIHRLDSPGRMNNAWNFTAAFMYDSFGTRVGFDGNSIGRFVMGRSFSTLGYSVLTSTGTVIQVFAPVSEKTFENLRIYLSSATSTCPVQLVFNRDTVTLKEVVATCDPLR